MAGQQKTTNQPLFLVLIEGSQASTCCCGRYLSVHHKTTVVRVSLPPPSHGIWLTSCQGDTESGKLGLGGIHKSTLCHSRGANVFFLLNKAPSCNYRISLSERRGKNNRASENTRESPFASFPLASGVRPPRR